MKDIPTAFILPGCPSAPESPICGLPRRERLRRTLEKRGFTIVEDSDRAQLKIPDCRVLVENEELHLCEAGIRTIEKHLLSSLRKSIALDGIIAYFLNRRISLAITRRLMNTRVTPNQVTIVTILLGIASGVAVSMGSYGSGVIGAVLLQLHAILDCVDGELARLKFQGSRLGQWLDTVSDDLAKLSFLVGATLIAPSAPLRWVGGLGCAAFVMAEGIRYFVIATVYRSGDLLDFQWDIGMPNRLGARLQLLFMHDFLCLLCLALALLGRIEIALVLVSIGAIGVLVSLTGQLIRNGASTQTAGTAGEGR